MKLRIVATALAAPLWCFFTGTSWWAARAWRTNDDYSHGFLVAPLCGYFIWERRHRLASLDIRPSLAGLVIIMVSLLLLIAGELGAELFLARVSLIGVLADR
jgi:hypothetical protein